MNPDNAEAEHLDFYRGFLNLKIMKLEEVKEYFKNADKCVSTLGTKFKMNDDLFEGIHRDFGEFYTTDGEFCLYEESTGFAKILTTKEKKFEITKEQVLKYRMKDEFPEVFEIEFEVGKWYKRIWKDGDVDLFLISDLIENKFITGEFFRNNERLTEGVGYIFENEKDERYFEIEAKEQEVKTALVNEAIKKYKKGNYIFDQWSQIKAPIERLDNFDYSYNSLFVLNNNNSKTCLFNNGKWATIIPTLTKKEAEEKLGVKII